MFSRKKFRHNKANLSAGHHFFSILRRSFVGEKSRKKLDVLDKKQSAPFMRKKNVLRRKIFQKRLEAFQEKLLLFFHRIEIKSQSRTTILFKNNCTGCFAKTQNEEFPTKKPKGLKKFLLSSECVIFLRSKEICNEVDVDVCCFR